MENKINIKEDFYTFKNQIIEEFGQLYYQQAEIFFERAIFQAENELYFGALADGNFALIMDLTTSDNAFQIIAINEFQGIVFFNNICFES